MKKFTIAVIAIAGFVSQVALAQTPSSSSGGMSMQGMDKGSMKGMDMKGMESSAKPGAVHKVSGTVKSVDQSAKTVTLDHGPVKTLNWPAMSMTFKVDDKVPMEKLKQGSKVDVDVVQRGKDYVVTAVNK